MEKDKYQDLLEKYKQRVEEEFGTKGSVTQKPISSQEYTTFKKELYPGHYSLFEKACNFSEKILKLKEDPKRAEVVKKNIEVSHLNVTPSGVLSFALLAGLLTILLGVLGGFAIPFLIFGEPLYFLAVGGAVTGLILIMVIRKVPDFMANTWRMKASNQMIQSIFYMVTYMRHTSNLERAIEFAANHVEPPLSLDFRKILWDVETEKFSTIRDAADNYLDKWKDWDKEFVEAFHLVEASLFESTEDRRLSLLDKALDVVLNGTYENMLHYAHDLKAPMTMLHMLGIILPILGLVILPLVVSFMAGDMNPFVLLLIISFLYNITLPTGVFYLGKTILSKRPAGYGATDISKKKGIKKLRNVNIPLGGKINISINPLFFSLTVLILALIIGGSPIILHTLDSGFEMANPDGTIKLLDYVCPPNVGPNCAENEKVGPFGLGASLLSLVLVAGLGLSIGMYFKLRSKNVIKIRNRTKLLEDEFSSALFQLGNRLGDGLPAEIAFSKIATTMHGTTSGDFFNLASRNITKLGMGLEESLFDPKVGALVQFPSKVIESSMKVLAESIKKGPRIAAQALLSMSRYIKEIHRVEARLKDLMADVISSMKAQVKFLTPAIAGIVIGITSMISLILTQLSGKLREITSGGDTGGFGNLLDLFGVGVPTFYFQIIVGIYIIQIAYILTTLANGIENGADKLGERYALGKNLVSSILLYTTLAGIVMLLFNFFAIKIMGQTFAG